MERIKEFMRHILGERRHQQAVVTFDRREPKMKMKDADEMLHNAIKELDETVRLRRDKFYDKIERERK